MGNLLDEEQVIMNEENNQDSASSFDTTDFIFLVLGTLLIGLVSCASVLIPW